MAINDETIRLILDMGQSGKTADEVRRKLDELGASARKTADSYEVLTRQVGTYEIATDRVNAELEEEVSRAAAATAAQRALGRALDETAAGAERAAASALKPGRAMLESGRVIQDFAQGGIAGILNNIEGLTSSLGLGAGLAGALTTVGVAAYIAGPKLKEMWDALTAMPKEKVPETTDRIEGMTKAIKANKDAMEELTGQGKVYAYELDILKERAFKLTQQEKELADAQLARSVGPFAGKAAQERAGAFRTAVAEIEQAWRGQGRDSVRPSAGPGSSARMAVAVPADRRGSPDRASARAWPEHWSSSTSGPWAPRLEHRVFLAGRAPAPWNARPSAGASRPRPPWTATPSGCARPGRRSPRSAPARPRRSGPPWPARRPPGTPPSRRPGPSGPASQAALEARQRAAAAQVERAEGVRMPPAEALQHLERQRRAARQEQLDSNRELRTAEAIYQVGGQGYEYNVNASTDQLRRENDRLKAGMSEFVRAAVEASAANISNIGDLRAGAQFLRGQVGQINQNGAPGVSGGKP